jgi:hypothetical protein
MDRPIDFRHGIAHHDHSVDPLRTVVDTHSGTESLTRTSPQMWRCRTPISENSGVLRMKP